MHKMKAPNKNGIKYIGLQDFKNPVTLPKRFLDTIN